MTFVISLTRDDSYGDRFGEDCDGFDFDENTEWFHDTIEDPSKPLTTEQSKAVECAAATGELIPKRGVTGRSDWSQ